MKKDSEDKMLIERLLLVCLCKGQPKVPCCLHTAVCTDHRRVQVPSSLYGQYIKQRQEGRSWKKGLAPLASTVLPLQMEILS